MNPLLRAACAAILALAAATALGATRYVSDELRISVRTGAGDEFRIIEVIGTGTRVETLQSQGEWAEVQTPAGNTGWVRAQYLEEQPSAEDRLRAARTELEQARERIGELETALSESRTSTAEAREQIAELTEANQRLEARLDEAQQGLELHDENERLKQHVGQYMRRTTELERQLQQVVDRQEKEWFVIGAGVLLGGMLVGIVMTIIPWRRRRDRMF
ncbi:MAG: TIGR04211 family SH3 domain-containing protein [Halofilum sp. (in: g-proteobacteria)]|nr:TIGR04211 family SH3 domain-containing protein [Halofilum sp. (in: g-proteobacteria)]